MCKQNEQAKKGQQQWKSESRRKQLPQKEKKTEHIGNTGRSMCDCNQLFLNFCKFFCFLLRCRCCYRFYRFSRYIWANRRSAVLVMHTRNYRCSDDHFTKSNAYEKHGLHVNRMWFWDVCNIKTQTEKKFAYRTIIKDEMSQHIQLPSANWRTHQLLVLLEMWFRSFL